jgi:hypothetical protein
MPGTRIPKGLQPIVSVALVLKIVSGKFACHASVLFCTVKNLLNHENLAHSIGALDRAASLID